MCALYNDDNDDDIMVCVAYKMLRLLHFVIAMLISLTMVEWLWLKLNFSYKLISWYGICFVRNI